MAAWKKIVTMVVCVMTSFCFAKDENRSVSAAESERIYVNLDQLLINEHGMFLFYSNEMFPVNALFYDQNGFYTIEKQLHEYSSNECPNGHPSRHGDGRCNQRECPYFRGQDQ